MSNLPTNALLARSGVWGGYAGTNATVNALRRS